MIDGKKVVFITGTSTGIGRASALLLARAGFRVFAGVRKEQDAASLRADEPAITPILIDVANANSIATARATLEARIDALDGLVNNAGVGLRAPLEYVPL